MLGLPNKFPYSMFKQHQEMWQSHLRYRGVWDMQDLYEHMGNYFRDRKYKFHETLYKHKHPSPYGSERQYRWHASIVVDDVYNFWIDMYLHTYDAQEIQVRDEKGKTHTYTKGRLWIEFNGDMNLYRDERFKKNRFNATLKQFINNWLKRRVHGDEVWDVLAYRELQRVIWVFRRRLKLEYNTYEQKHWMGVHA